MESSWSKRADEGRFETLWSKSSDEGKRINEAFGDRNGLNDGKSWSQDVSAFNDSKKIVTSLKCDESMRNELDRAIETGNWIEVDKQASLMLLGTAGANNSKNSKDNESFALSYDDESDSRDAWSTL